MQPELICPLGSKCTEIKNNALYQCAWYCEMTGRNPQTGGEENKKGCALAFLPLLMVENVGTMRGVQAATEDFRNHLAQGIASLVLSQPRPSLFTDRYGKSVTAELPALNDKED